MTTTRHLEILVEEDSIKALLETLLPRILPAGRTFSIHPHQGKSDLLSKLRPRLRAYREWLPPDWQVIVIVDCDSDDCLTLKAIMEQTATDAGLTTRSTASGGMWQIANRIAIEELEAWYFGDWLAVLAAYPRMNPNVPSKARFRNPDAISGGTWEAFEQILQRHGYFRSGLRKVEAAQAIAEHMDVSRNTSRSFAEFAAAVTESAPNPRPA